jgi:hypothetical protein
MTAICAKRTILFAGREARFSRYGPDASAFSFSPPDRINTPAAGVRENETLGAAVARRGPYPQANELFRALAASDDGHGGDEPLSAPAPGCLSVIA